MASYMYVILILCDLNYMFYQFGPKIQLRAFFYFFWYWSGPVLEPGPNRLVWNQLVLVRGSLIQLINF